MSKTAIAIAALWTSPNSLIGLLLGAAGLCAGARLRWHRRELALVFVCYPWGPRGALTLGNVILTAKASLDVSVLTYSCKRHVRLGDHERGHVFQYMALGPLFLPLYLLGGIAHATNRFEIAADRYALTGRGWWPWSKSYEHR